MYPASALQLPLFPLVSFLLFLVTLLKTSACPVNNELVLQRCSCESSSSGNTLDCSNSNFNDTMRILRTVKNELGLLQELTFRNASIYSLPERAFEGFFVKKLDLSDNDIHEIDAQAFRSLENILQILYVSNNQLREVPSEALTGMAALLQLDLSNNSIGNLASEVLFNVPKIYDLNLADNRICKVYKDAFSSVKQSLQTLNLGGNCLNKVPAAAIRGFQQLLALHLHNNRIPQLEPLQFMNMPALYLVNLAGNEISKLHRQAFLNVPNLKFLYLGDNNIDTLEPQQFQPFDSLELLDLSRNKITKIPSQAFANLPRLSQLYLTQNGVEEIEGNAFSNSSIVILLLNNNRLRQLTAEMLFGLNSVQQFSLRNNQIGFIAQNAFYQMPSLVVLDLSSNNISALYPATFLAQLGMFMLDFSNNQLTTVPYNAFNQRIVTVVFQENPLVCTERIHVLQNGIGVYVPGTPDVICGGSTGTNNEAAEAVPGFQNVPPDVSSQVDSGVVTNGRNPLQQANVDGTELAPAIATNLDQKNADLRPPSFRPQEVVSSPGSQQNQFNNQFSQPQQPAAGSVDQTKTGFRTINAPPEVQLNNNTVLINQPGKIVPQNINNVPLYTFNLPAGATRQPTQQPQSPWKINNKINTQQIDDDTSSLLSANYSNSAAVTTNSLNPSSAGGSSTFQIQTGFPHFPRGNNSAQREPPTPPIRVIGGANGLINGNTWSGTVGTGGAESQPATTGSSFLATLPPGIVTAGREGVQTPNPWRPDLLVTKQGEKTPANPELRTVIPKKPASELADELGTLPNPQQGETTASLSASTTIAVCLTVVIVVMLVVFVTLCVVRYRSTRHHSKHSESSASRTSAYVAAQAARANYAACAAAAAGGSIYGGTYMREVPPRPPTRNGGAKTPTGLQQPPQQQHQHSGWIYAPTGTYATATYYK